MRIKYKVNMKFLFVPIIFHWIFPFILLTVSGIYSKQTGKNE